jgi:hypothetical protein
MRITQNTTSLLKISGGSENCGRVLSVCRNQTEVAHVERDTLVVAAADVVERKHVS